MNHPRIVDVLRRAVFAASQGGPAFGDAEGNVPVSHYTSPERLESERRALFRALPIPVAHASELAEPYRVLVREVDGVSLLLLRDEDGVVRAFRNACRHRGVRLLASDGTAKAFVCRYHGWTYDKRGSLLHVPHENAFPRCAKSEHGLTLVTVEERHGLVWASLADSPRLSNAPTSPVASLLGELDEELGSLGLDQCVVGERVVSEQRGNWKMLMEAFLDGYHIRTLHRDSVYPFFVDARSIADRVGPHVRAASARRIAKEVHDEASFAARVDRDPRELATVSYMLFPCTTLVLHPDWTSLVVVQPLAVDRFVWSHTQLLPSSTTTASDEARAHYARSFALIEGRVFQGEDLMIVAEAQRGLEAGANDVVMFGLLESPAVWLHESIAARVARE